MSDKSPFEIAREALKLLSSRKQAPDPANFQGAYSEVSGTPAVQPFPEDAMRQIAQALPAKNPGQQKQKGLLESAIAQHAWAGVRSALVAYAEAGAVAPVARAAAKSETAVTAELLEQVARLIENALPALGADDARFAEQASHLLQTIRDPACGIAAVKPMLGNFNLRLSFAAEDQAEIRLTLLKLLHLTIENIGELTLDDRWLQRDIGVLLAAATPPLTLRRLDDVERHIKNVMFKQVAAKGRALEAQEQMRQMLALFIERLAQMTEVTSVHHGRMEEGARLIERAKSLEEIAPVMKDLVGATRGMADAFRNTHDELRAMREKVQATEAEIVKLHEELDHVSAQARHDMLTGALNRKGLDEALARELAEVQRKEIPLCVTLLDIDNFKKLNDSKGHATGDAALAHLATVTRESMRPHDTLARYGGEEFVILMPDTPLDQGIEAMTRLQRELTRRFFLAGNDKIVITFSAGVAQLAPGEEANDAIARADKAMYLAKRAGKNRVVGA
jgi:diguanylate cyclase